MPLTSDSWLWSVATRLLDGSVSGAVVIALVWLACRRVGSIPPSARALLWWLASLKLVVSLLPMPSFGVAVLPVTVDAPASIGYAPVAPPLPSRVVDEPTRVTTPPPETAPTPTLATVVMVLVALWIVGLAVHASLLVAAYARLRRTVRRSSPVAPDEAEMVGHLADRLALRNLPTVRVSSDVRTPLVVGIVWPTVLLPAADLSALTPGEREMALCHELAHIRRRDLMFGWIPAIAERLFFFHPLARIAAREYVAEREAACDALVVSVMDVAPHDYGQMLVRLGVGRVSPAWTATISSPSMSSLRRRLAMLHDSTPPRSRRAGITLFAVVAAATVVPLQFTARSIQEPTAAAQAAPAPARTQPAPAAAAAVPVQRPVTKAPQPAPATKATPAQDEELRKAVAAQRNQMREIERALVTMRRQFEELLERTEAMRAASNADQRAVRGQTQVVPGQQRPDQVSTQEFLEERLRVLLDEKGAIERRLRQLTEEIEAIRPRLEPPR